ncbi:MAG TPA: hypothetical protein VHK03_03050 [Aestuariivirgaceae bacterium]|nr:hypothetical protein [Aestuariivirgaceae bacterium]
MAVLRVTQQRIVDAFHSLEQRFEQFRRGAADRVPDFTEFRRKVADFFARTFVSKKQDPIVDVRPQHTITPEKSPQIPDPDLGDLDKPFIQKWRPVSGTTVTTGTVPTLTIGHPAPISKKPTEAEPVAAEAAEKAEGTERDLVSTITELASDIGDAAGSVAARIAKGTDTLLEATSEAIQEAAHGIVETAGDAIDRAANWLTGSPPLGETAPPEPRQLANDGQDGIQSELPAQPEKSVAPKSQVPDEHPESMIAWIRERIHGKAQAAIVDEPKRRQDARPAEERPFTEAELAQAALLVRHAALRAEADEYKEQETMFGDQLTVTPGAEVEIEPDPLEAEEFSHWGAPDEAVSETERTAVEPPPARHKDEKRQREIETRRRELETLGRKVKQQWSDIRSAEQGRDAWEEKFSEEFDGSPKPAAPRRRQPSIVQAASEKPMMAEGRPPSGEWPKRHPRHSPIKIEPKLRGILREPKSAARPDAPIKTVRFNEEISVEKTYDDRSRSLKRRASRRVGVDRSERDRETAKLRRLHREAKKVPDERHIDTDKFLDLMTIAQDKGPAHAHGLAIQLYRRYRSQSASGDWTKDAERSLHAQLQGRSKTEALNALEPVIAHFDRYKVLEDHTKVLADETEREDFSALIQLGAILHRIRRDLTVGALTPPDSRTSL